MRGVTNELLRARRVRPAATPSVPRSGRSMRRARVLPPAPADARRPPAPRRVESTHRTAPHRQGDGEGRTLADRTLDADRAAVQVHEPLRERQPEPAVEERPKGKSRWAMVAVAVIVLIGAGLYWFTQPGSAPAQEPPNPAASSVSAPPSAAPQPSGQPPATAAPVAKPSPFDTGAPPAAKPVTKTPAAPVPAGDPRIDYYTGNPDFTDVGGAPTTRPGYGPNTRTLMQITVGNAVTTPSVVPTQTVVQPTASLTPRPIPTETLAPTQTQPPAQTALPTLAPTIPPAPTQNRL